MEDDAKQMEAKLELLRRAMDEAERSSAKGPDGGRWRSGSTAKPLTKGYVKSVIEAARPKPRSLIGSQHRTPSATNTPGEVTPSGVWSQEASSFSQLLGGDSFIPRTVNRSGGSTITAASNLQAAMRQQNHEATEVETFLADLKLDRYVGLFMEHGFDCMDVVRDMEEHHMQTIGMAAGHILKLRKRIAELRPQPVPVPPATPPTDASASQRRVTFGATEKQAIPKAPTSVSTGGGATKLSHGAFDEEESAASFQEALRAWREGGKAKESNEDSASKAGGSFWARLGEAEVNLERCSTPLRPPSELASTETQHHPAPSEEKLCCYQCYKQFFAQYAIERQSPLCEEQGGGKKRLCSEACADAWLKATQLKAEAYQKRQQQIQKMKEMQQALEVSSETGEQVTEPLSVVSS